MIFGTVDEMLTTEELYAILYYKTLSTGDAMTVGYTGSRKLLIDTGIAKKLS